MDALSLLFPRRCVFCRVTLRRLAPGEPCLCDACQNSLAWYRAAQGPKVFAPLYYRDAARLAVHRYKFTGAVSYARTFGILMAQTLHGEAFDCVTWVPSSFLRRLQRRYDQSHLLAREVAARLQIPLIPLLRRKRHGRAQFRQKNASARRENVKGAYAVRSGVVSRVPPGARVLLVDDIHTTGATFDECARVLSETGLPDVRLVCVARVK